MYLLPKVSQSEIDRIWQLGLKLSYPTDLLRIPGRLDEVLDDLGRRYILGIITSRTRKGLAEFFGVTGIKPATFHSVVTCEDCKHQKPHAEPLLRGCEALCINAGEVVYVVADRTPRL